MEMKDLHLESVLEIDPAAPQTLADHTFNSLRSPAPRARISSFENDSSLLRMQRQKITGQQ